MIMFKTGVVYPEKMSSAAQRPELQGPAEYVRISLLESEFLISLSFLIPLALVL